MHGDHLILKFKGVDTISDAERLAGADVAIPIEQRADQEVTVPAAPDGTRALNLAFDITPAELVTAVVTEERLIPGGRPA